MYSSRSNELKTERGSSGHWALNRATCRKGDLWKFCMCVCFFICNHYLTSPEVLVVCFGIVQIKLIILLLWMSTLSYYYFVQYDLQLIWLLKIFQLSCASVIPYKEKKLHLKIWVATPELWKTISFTVTQWFHLYQLGPWAGSSDRHCSGISGLPLLWDMCFWIFTVSMHPHPGLFFSFPQPNVSIDSYF